MARRSRTIPPLEPACLLNEKRQTNTYHALDLWTLASSLQSTSRAHAPRLNHPSHARCCFHALPSVRVDHRIGRSSIRLVVFTATAHCRGDDRAFETDHPLARDRVGTAAARTWQCSTESGPAGRPAHVSPAARTM
jgi:hypothetical protein